MDGRAYAGVTHNRLRKAAQGAGPSAKWVQCRRWVTVGGRAMAECEPVSDAGGWTKADKFARHIAAANPAAVLAMLDRIQELEAERGDLLAMLEQARQQLATAAATADKVAKEAVTFMNQRDWMLDALRICKHHFLSASANMPEEFVDELEEIDEFIAEAKGWQL